MPAVTASSAVQQFRGPGVLLTIAADRVELQQTGLWRRLLPRRRGVSIARRQITDARVLAWGKALLVVTDSGPALTVPLGTEAAAACAALLRPLVTQIAAA
jgi:hypothetical protein